MMKALVGDLGSQDGTYIAGRALAKVMAPGTEGIALGDASAAPRVPPPAALPAPSKACMIAASPHMLELRRIVALVARKPMPVLVTGETGTGKEVLVNALHERSGLSGSLLTINCGAIPRELSEGLLFGHEKGAFTGADRRCRGLFEEAHKGTLFLDEIAELPLCTQAVLLRVLQHKRFARVGSTVEIAVDVRIVAATHQDLEQRVREGSFREDLFYRLNTVTLHVPPLRERIEDIEPLALHFLAQTAAEQGSPVRTLGEAAISRLREYHWPGNVRQLRSVIERAVAFCAGTSIDLADIPSALSERPPRALELAATNGMSRQQLPQPQSTTTPAMGEREVRSFKERVRAYEVQIISQGLRQASGNVTKTAELLRIPVRTLTHKVRAYGLRGNIA